ncbi:SAF domain-containing protein [Demequina sp.]|uniref:SAF domain-containing protein n=1 Tax=Demequina sp. TaxID=2050685 RepID=UPI003D0F8C57
MAASTDAVVGRVKRPSWRDPRLLVGLALIAIAVAAVVAIVQRADTTQPFYAAAHDLAPGTVLTDDDLVVVHVRVSSGEYVPQSDGVAGKVLDRAVGEGELVPASALVSADGFGARAIAVESSLPLADGVGVGSRVDVWVTTPGDAGPTSVLVGSDLAVTDVREAKASLGSDGGQTVYVAVPLADVADVLNAVSSDGDIAIVAAGS